MSEVPLYGRWCGGTSCGVVVWDTILDVMGGRAVRRDAGRGDGCDLGRDAVFWDVMRKRDDGKW